MRRKYARKSVWLGLILAGILSFQTLAAQIALPAAGAKSGLALLDKLDAFHEKLARENPPSDVIAGAVADMRKAADQALAVLDITQPFHSRYTRMLSVIGLVAAIDPKMDREKAEKDIERFVRDILGQSWGPDAGATEQIGKFSEAVATEMTRLRDGLLGVKSKTPSVGPEPVRVGQDIPEPKLVTRVEPVYPSVAFQARIEGTVILEITVDVQGRVKDAKVLRSIPLLDQAALDAVKQWVYEPFVVDGVPRGFIATVTVGFNIK